MYENNNAVAIGCPPITKKPQFEIVPPFNASNTGEQFIYYDNEREHRTIISATPLNLYCFYKIWKIGSCMTHFLLFPHNAFSFIQSMEFITLEMLLERIIYLKNKRWETYTEVHRQLQHLTNNIVLHRIMINRAWLPH